MVPKTAAPASMADGSPFGMLSGRIATWIQVVCTSRASLPPFETPWSKMAGFGGVAPANGQAPLPAALSGGSPPANPFPHCTLRELLLKSVGLSRAALQLLIRMSCAPLIFE